jgi:hypothetical protein
MFKKSTLATGLAALAFAVTLCFCPLTMHAQSQQSAAPHAQTMPHSFTGTVIKLQNGHYALVMGKGPNGQPMGHFLDHSKMAKQFVGKKVKVTGKFNPADNTVEVTNIQPR